MTHAMRLRFPFLNK
ncbi:MULTISPECIES: erythromycin resistance leader peptide [Paenibacillus]